MDSQNSNLSGKYDDSFFKYIVKIFLCKINGNYQGIFMSFTSLYGSYLELVQLLQTEVSAITTIYISILKHLFPLLDRTRKKMFMQPND